MNQEDAIRAYAISVSPLPEDLGGGYEALYTPLARTVVGSGQTRDAAIRDSMDAVPGFVALLEETGQSLPEASSSHPGGEFSGKFNVRVPKSLHRQLVELAATQGVSLNSLVQTLLASSATAMELGLRPTMQNSGASVCGGEGKSQTHPPRRARSRTRATRGAEVVASPG